MCVMPLKQYLGWNLWYNNCIINTTQQTIQYIINRVQQTMLQEKKILKSMITAPTQKLETRKRRENKTQSGQKGNNIRAKINNIENR